MLTLQLIILSQAVEKSCYVGADPGFTNGGPNLMKAARLSRQRRRCLDTKGVEGEGNGEGTPFKLTPQPRWNPSHKWFGGISGKAHTYAVLRIFLEHF